MASGNQRSRSARSSLAAFPRSSLTSTLSKNLPFSARNSSSLAEVASRSLILSSVSVLRPRRRLSISSSPLAP